ncbi:hypothetical protein CISG_08596 [Coccidioides immitis RMSCC 3703]|uniref:Uncharacterized protein n=1 Tax=Coccidioides immitis RMSCC 3703 TaxID=454286 RepID=A0A0J8RAB5_COCIT|nr:hypothetical protein CISG_08596 [Coccidioides immitis RMSCC 3703]
MAWMMNSARMPPCSRGSPSCGPGSTWRREIDGSDVCSISRLVVELGAGRRSGEDGWSHCRRYLKSLTFSAALLQAGSYFLGPASVNRLHIQRAKGNSSGNRA